MIPVLPFLGLSLGLNQFEIGIIVAVFSFAQFFSSPVTGKLSDRYGRKPILIVSQISTFIGFVLLGFATAIWILVTARLIDGLFGSNMTVTQAYLSDITPPEDRTRIYGYSSAVFGGALIFGPVIGGLSSQISFSTPMFIAAGISLISIVLVIFILPESIPDRGTSKPLDLAEIVPYKHARKFFGIPRIRRILILYWIYNLGFILFITSFVLFLDLRYQVDGRMVGFYFGWLGILRVVMQAGMISPLINRLGEKLTLILGLISMMVSLLSFIVIINIWLIFIPMTFLAFGTGVCRPILISRLSQVADQKETGTLMGVSNSLGSIAQFTMPLLGGAILLLLPALVLPIASAFLFLILTLLITSLKASKPMEVRSDKQPSIAG